MVRKSQARNTIFPFGDQLSTADAAQLLCEDELMLVYISDLAIHCKSSLEVRFSQESPVDTELTLGSEGPCVSQVLGNITALDKSSQSPILTSLFYIRILGHR